MKVVLLFCFFVAFAWANDATRKNLWPLPQSFQSTDDRTLIIERVSFQFESGGQNSEILQEAFQRYYDLLFPPVHKTHASKLGLHRMDGLFSKPSKMFSLRALVVSVASSDISLQHGVNEEYTLVVPDGETAELKAETVWGALRGLETFSQLMQKISADEYYVFGVPLTITDGPRFPHRGLLIDSSRNFLTLSALFKTIDSLAYTKMNVLHWHITDSQAFPYHVQQFDQLSKGAYSQYEIYSREDIASVIDYGYKRGVRVIPEFDSPGHAYAWGIGYPNITSCPDATPFTDYCYQPPCGQLKPSVDFTYDVVSGVFSQASEDFPDHFLHLGFDEVNERCWLTDPDVLDFMQENQFTTYNEVLQYYADKLIAVTTRLNKTPVFWQEAFDHGLVLPKDSIFQIWNQRASLTPILRAGYRAILSNNDQWYLDCGFGDWLTGGDTFYCDYNNWKSIYLNEPVPAEIENDPEAVARLIGGEVCSWGESVDSTSMDGRIWPRAAAAGERLWSSKGVVDANDAIIRLSVHRDRLVQRGINASALRMKWCDLHPGSCDVNLTQKDTATEKD